MTEESNTIPIERARWRRKLLRDRQGEIRGTHGNALAILTHDPRLRGVFAWDDFAARLTVQRRPPWREPDDNYPHPVSDATIVHLVAWLEKHHRTAFPFESAARALETHGLAHRVDPLRDYLMSLEWDGVPRCEFWLHRYLGAELTPLTRMIGARWMVQAVARALHPGVQADHVLVLEGSQGLGKSTALRILGGAWHSDQLPEIGSKDAYLALSRVWILEIAELVALRRSDIERVKAFITATVDHYRMPYGRQVVDRPRRCVFAATTNDASYLADATGSRRFWPVRCGIDPAWRPEMVRDLAKVAGQCWAEARLLLADGAPLFLPEADLRADLAAAHADRADADPWDDYVAGRCAAAPAWLTTTDLLKGLGVGLDKATKADAMRLAALLRRNGYGERKRVRLLGGGHEWRYLPASTVNPAPIPPVRETGSDS